MIHPQMATMLSVVLTDAAVAPDVAVGPAPAGRGADLGPALGRRRHEHERHRLRPRVRGVGGRAGGGRFGGRRRPRRARSRRRARPGPPAGGRRRGCEHAHHGGRDRRPRRRRGAGRRPGGRLVEPGQGGGPRPRPELGPHRGCGRQRPAGRRGGARGGRPAAGGGGGPCRYARPCSIPRRSGSAIAGHLVFDGAQGGPVAFDRAAARAAMDAPEVVLALDLGLGDGPRRGASAAT